MPLSGRIFAGDEELGKKDDDHRRRNGSTVAPSVWSWMTGSIPRMRRHRLGLGVVIIIGLYIFFSNVPNNSSPITDQIHAGGHTQNGDVPRAYEEAPFGKPPQVEDEIEKGKHYYNGPVRFFYLATSLHAIARTMGYRDVNKNVLYAAANLQSASRLIPMACEMARWNRNVVHFAFLGRDDISLKDIQIINGVGAECGVFWHDARPDYSPWSSDGRMEVSVVAALEHMYGLMHPQVYIIDESELEASFFVKGIRLKSQEQGRTLIELPANAAEKLLWMTRLDSGSLRAWHNTYVDILIHAPTESSGSLIRLLKSIEAADYFGTRRPHLTIELPMEIDPPTWSFLENLVWPPLDPAGAPHTSQVTLRHRMSSSNIKGEDGSIRFIESFYTARPEHSHVLVLSPQVELSRMYHHYLLYNILEYKHSMYGANTFQAGNLIGLSLDLPSYYPDNTTPFQPPQPSSSPVTTSTLAGPEVSPAILNPSPFLYKSPSSQATLYFGTFWLELHSYLAHLTILPSSPAALIPPLNPPYLTHIQTLVLARAYTILYPSTSSIARVHNDPHTPPEYVSPITSTYTSQPPRHKEQPLLTSPLLTLLPNEGDLPELAALPLLSHTGAPTNQNSANQAALKFADKFKAEIGRCVAGAIMGKGMHKYRKFGTADDLFCLDEEDEEEDEERMGKDNSVENKSSSLQGKKSSGAADGESKAVEDALTKPMNKEPAKDTIPIKDREPREGKEPLTEDIKAAQNVKEALEGNGKT